MVVALLADQVASFAEAMSRDYAHLQLWAGRLGVADLLEGVMAAAK